MRFFEGEFDEAEDVFSAFLCDEADREGVDILYAEYENGGYDGTAFVIFLKNGELFEVNASHCSCHGLGDQWYPEETSWEDLQFRHNSIEDPNLCALIEAELARSFFYEDSIRL